VGGQFFSFFFLSFHFFSLVFFLWFLFFMWHFWNDMAKLIGANSWTTCICVKLLLDMKWPLAYVPLLIVKKYNIHLWSAIHEVVGKLQPQNSSFWFGNKKTLRSYSMSPCWCKIFWKLKNAPRCNWCALGYSKFTSKIQ
jgi:hypothetical protein